MIHYGWVVVFACLVVGVCGYGTFFSFTLFYPHLVAEFGWSRTAISGAMSLGIVAYSLFALPMGWCADRFGPRLTVVAGGILFGGGTALGAAMTELWHLYALYGGVTAIGMGTVWSPLVSTVSRWFERRRGLALGIATLGGGSGVFFVAPLAESLIVHHGWRGAYLSLGAITGGLIVGAALLLSRDPAARGSSPLGAGEGATTRPATHVEVDLDRSAPNGLAEIARTWLFWRMSLTFGLWWFAGALVYVQIAPYLLEKGLGSPFVALAVTLFGAGACAGRIAMGIVCDRIGARRAYQISVAVAAVAMSAIAFAAEPKFVLACAIVLGFGIGGASTQLTTVSVALFGVASGGALMGAVLALVGLVGSGGPFVSGMIRDVSLSYTPAFHVGAGVLALSLALSTSLRHRGRSGMATRVRKEDVGR